MGGGIVPSRYLQQVVSQLFTSLQFKFLTQAVFRGKNGVDGLSSHALGYFRRGTSEQKKTAKHDFMVG